MTVMSNTYFDNRNHFSKQEIGAARNAWLRYERHQQLHLLNVMPIDEAVAILQHCSISYAQKMILALEAQGKQSRANHYAKQLGLKTSKQLKPNWWRKMISKPLRIVLTCGLLSLASGASAYMYW